jgi:hypothetical protein
LRGPSGGLILARDATWKKALNAAIFPGVQGSLHPQVIAAKAVCLGEALQPAFKLITPHGDRKPLSRLDLTPPVRTVTTVKGAV